MQLQHTKCVCGNRTMPEEGIELLGRVNDPSSDIRPFKAEDILPWESALRLPALSHHPTPLKRLVRRPDTGHTRKERAHRCVGCVTETQSLLDNPTHSARTAGAGGGGGGGGRGGGGGGGGAGGGAGGGGPATQTLLAHPTPPALTPPPPPPNCDANHR